MECGIKNATVFPEILPELCCPLRFLVIDPRYVSVLDHMLNLLPHCDSKQGYEVYQEDWPKNWDVQEGEERAHESKQAGTCHGVPSDGQVFLFNTR